MRVSPCVSSPATAARASFGASLAILVALGSACDPNTSAPTTPKVKRTPEEVFLAECAACHGADGTGGNGPSLFDRVPKVMDEALVITISQGKGGMPPRPGVTKDEMIELVPYLREKFGAYVDPTPGPMMRDGATIFAAECAMCHGADGSGGRFAPNLHDRVPARDDTALRNIITMGTGMMPARNVVEPDLTTLMTYLRATFGAYVPPMPGDEGHTIFEAQCSRCHGMDGVSGRAPNLSERIPDLSNPFLTLTITVGSGNMRPRMVTETELGQLITYLRATHGAYAHGSPDVPISANGGMLVWGRECSRCHGEDGTGRTAGELVTKTPMLSNALLVHAITNDPGHAGLTPVAEPNLTPLVAFMRQVFGAYAPPMRLPDGGVPPVGGMDGGTTITEDAGSPSTMDAGVAPDTGVVVAPDASAAPDATIAVDAAVSDAGARPDAQTQDAAVNVDAGAATDAGAASDAGTPATDAGTPVTPAVLVSCGNGTADGLETCDGTNWASWSPGPACSDFGLGTGNATCAAGCYADLSACSIHDLCAEQGWYGDGWCDACDRLGGTVDPDCATVCGADGLCGEYWDTLTGVWTCRAQGLVDPDCGTCGDGMMTDGELCDGADLGGYDCTDYGYRSGTLTCAVDCLPDLAQCSQQLCSNTCRWANDGECDDGGPMSDYSLCPLGSDCGDCGPR